MWSKVCRITNFVIMVLFGLVFLIAIVDVLCNMTTIFNDVISRTYFVGNINASGVMFYILVYYWQSGSISRLKGEIKDQTLMW